MNAYIKNLLPRLRQYGQKLEKIETFVDKTWTFYDEDGNLCTYRFKRNGDLRVSINGNYTDFKWQLEGAVYKIEDLSPTTSLEGVAKIGGNCIGPYHFLGILFLIAGIENPFHLASSRDDLKNNL